LDFRNSDHVTAQGSSTIDVVLPVLDEAAAIPGVLGAFPTGYRPIVVDNGSSDGSDAIAAELGATVVSEPRRGFGAACFAGLIAASSDVICFMDCDGSLDPRELERVSAPVVAGDADLVLGTRIAEAGAWPLHARVANRALGLMVRRRAGRLTDIGPMRAARREALIDLGLRDRRFGWPLEMVLRAADRGWRIEEAPVSYRRRDGRSKVTGTVRGTARTIGDMTKAMRADRSR
jgi:glycosyltransferase involved in cell wall biosynthesis